MEVKLNKPDLHGYINADHIEFHTLSYGICDRNSAVINAPELITDYSLKVTQEETVYKWMRRSEYTAKKAETDHSRDRAFRNIVELVRIQLKHFSPAVRDNALHVYNLLENYGDLTHADYDAETAGIDSIVTRLHSDVYLPAVQNLELVPWISELASLNTLFKSYVDDTLQEQIHKPDISFRSARRETDGALRKITRRVSALIDLNGGANYAGFAKEFNVLVNHYNTLVHEHYGRLHAKTDITPADIAPIAVQPWTGKPVCVIPEVSIRITGKDGETRVVELVFSEDFSVAYKNNVEPGTATLFIKGIGKYTGELVTTFNIEAPVCDVQG
ncbi:MAG: DUF6261 family protein [Tannerella sp.]|jgi:hypothetical protein|nr:DUF6261 family protein [Tannerella sp.]